MNRIDNLLNDLNELVRRAATGDAQSLVELFNNPDFLRMVKIQCLSIRFKGRKRGGANNLEDLMQVTLMKILCALPQYRGESINGRKPLASWINQIAKNIYLRDVEREATEKAGMEKIDWLPPAAFKPTIEMEAALKEAYETLDPDERSIFDLHLEGSNPRQITEALYASEQKSWGDKKRKNEIEKVRKKLKVIIEKIAAALGIHQRNRSAGA